MQGSDRKWYGKYGIGQPLIAAGLHVIGRILKPYLEIPHNDPEIVSGLFVHMLPVVATALTVLLVYLFGKGLYGSVKTGLALAVLYGLGTSAWPYTRIFFSEPLFTLCCVAAAYAIWRAGRSERRTGWLALAGFALGYALLTKISGAALLPAYAVYLWLIQKNLTPTPSLRRRGLENQDVHLPSALRTSLNEALGKAARVCPERSRTGRVRQGREIGEAGVRFLRDGLIVFIAALPALLLLLLHNYARFGNPFNNGYDGESFTTFPLVGLVGLLFSPGKSVFLYSPVLLALPFAVRPFWRRFRPEAIFFSILIALTLAYYSGWWAWWGGWCWGPRFLVPVLPFAVLFLGTLLERSRAWVAIIWLGFFPVALVVQVLGIIPDFNTYMIAATQGGKLRDVVFIWNPRATPLWAHWKAVWQPNVSTVRGLWLGSLGFKFRPALMTSALCLLSVAGAMIVICRNLLTPRLSSVGGVTRPDNRGHVPSDTAALNEVRSAKRGETAPTIANV